MLTVHSSPYHVKLVYKGVIPVCLFNISLRYVLIDVALCDGFPIFFEKYSLAHKKLRFNKIKTAIIIHVTHMYLRHLGVLM